MTIKEIKEKIANLPEDADARVYLNGLNLDTKPTDNETIEECLKMCAALQKKLNETIVEYNKRFRETWEEQKEYIRLKRKYEKGV